MNLNNTAKALRAQMVETHGEEFMDNFDEEFEIDINKPTLRTKILDVITSDRALFYVAGVGDAIILWAIVTIWMN